MPATWHSQQPAVHHHLIKSRWLEIAHPAACSFSWQGIPQSPIEFHFSLGRDWGLSNCQHCSKEATFLHSVALPSQSPKLLGKKGVQQNKVPLLPESQSEAGQFVENRIDALLEFGAPTLRQCSYSLCKPGGFDLAVNTKGNPLKKSTPTLGDTDNDPILPWNTRIVTLNSKCIMSPESTDQPRKEAISIPILCAHTLQNKISSMPCGHPAESKHVSAHIP